MPVSALGLKQHFQRPRSQSTFRNCDKGWECMIFMWLSYWLLFYRNPHFPLIWSKELALKWFPRLTFEHIQHGLYIRLVFLFLSHVVFDSIVFLPLSLGEFLSRSPDLTHLLFLPFENLYLSPLYIPPTDFPAPNPLYLSFTNILLFVLALCCFPSPTCTLSFLCELLPASLSLLFCAQSLIFFVVLHYGRELSLSIFFVFFILTYSASMLSYLTTCIAPPNLPHTFDCVSTFHRTALNSSSLVEFTVVRFPPCKCFLVINGFPFTIKPSSRPPDFELYDFHPYCEMNRRFL